MIEQTQVDKCYVLVQLTRIKYICGFVKVDG